jgi:hypothetical protein
MKRVMLESVAALLLMSGTVNATCVYQGVSYSEGARVCMHRTMFMCRGRQWIKTAERCWERSLTSESSLPRAQQRLPGAFTQGRDHITTCNTVASEEAWRGAIAP